jgi:hypothetical protein
LLATVDDAGDVIALSCGVVVTDDLLVRIATLPRLRELDIASTKSLTKRGIPNLGRMTSLEALRLTDVNEQGNGLGDAALAAASRIPNLRELSIAECGTTDDGVRYVRLMPRLTRLTLRQEGRLTDAALASVSRVKQLTRLDLSSYVATAAYGWMRFSPDSLSQLSALRDLEVLRLAGQAPKAELFPMPKLKSLSVGAVDQAAAARIAQCGELRSLELLYSGITDEGLREIARLPELRRLSLSSTIVTDAGIAHLKALPNVEHVELRATSVGDEAIGHLSQMKTLTRVDLDGNGRPGAFPGRRFTADGLRRLKQLPGLRTLYLTNLELAGGSGALKELTQLRELSLMMTDIKDLEVADLEAALPDTVIHAANGAGRVGGPRAYRKR